MSGRACDWRSEVLETVCRVTSETEGPLAARPSAIAPWRVRSPIGPSQPTHPRTWMDRVSRANARISLPSPSSSRPAPLPNRRAIPSDDTTSRPQSTARTITRVRNRIDSVQSTDAMEMPSRLDSRGS